MLLHQVVIEKIVGHHADVHLVYPGQKVTPNDMDITRDRIINCAAANSDEFGMAMEKDRSLFVAGNGVRRAVVSGVGLALAMVFLFVC